MNIELHFPCKVFLCPLCGVFVFELVFAPKKKPFCSPCVPTHHHHCMLQQRPWNTNNINYKIEWSKNHLVHKHITIHKVKNPEVKMKRFSISPHFHHTWAQCSNLEQSAIGNCPWIQNKNRLREKRSSLLRESLDENILRTSHLGISIPAWPTPMRAGMMKKGSIVIGCHCKGWV